MYHPRHQDKKHQILESKKSTSPSKSISSLSSSSSSPGGLTGSLLMGLNSSYSDFYVRLSKECTELQVSKYSSEGASIANGAL